MESTLVSIEQKRFVNRGFLIGPLCPIYGFGCIIIYFLLNRYSNNVFILFVIIISPNKV